MSLYVNLYRSVPRGRGSIRENFVTEALADLMNRLEHRALGATRNFITDTLLRKPVGELTHLTRLLSTRETYSLGYTAIYLVGRP
jgi:hypothetical protein